MQPRTWRAASATQSCVRVKASALAGTAALTSAGETTLQHTTTVPETYAAMNLMEAPFFTPCCVNCCANCCVCWLPPLSVFLNSSIKSSFHQWDVTLHFFFVLNSQPDYVLLNSGCMSECMKRAFCISFFLTSQGFLQHHEIKGFTETTSKITCAH